MGNRSYCPDQLAASVNRDSKCTTEAARILLPAGNKSEPWARTVGGGRKWRAAVPYRRQQSQACLHPYHADSASLAVVHSTKLGRQKKAQRAGFGLQLFTK